MLKLLAQFISFIFHPLLMPTWLFGIVMFYLPSSVQPRQAWMVIIILVFGMTFILPLLNLLFFKMTGTIKSFYLAERSDRILPFIFITIVYAGITAMIFWKMSFPVVFNLMLLITLLSLMVTVATFFFKISAHAVGGGGIAGILLATAIISSVGELIYPSLLILVLAGAVMSARLYLNAHKPNEVGWGGMLGFLVGFVGIELLF
jgi:hypothetical protein